MEQNYVFMTDSDSDLPFHLKEQYNIPVVYMPYALDGKEYFDDLGQMLDHKSYFTAMRNGAVPVTSALNEASYMDYFEPILKEGKDLLFVAFSSKLSCTLQAVYSAREKLLEEIREVPDPKVLGSSLAVGMADFMPGKDESVFTVFTHADRMMYQQKSEMKKKLEA